MKKSTHISILTLVILSFVLSMSSLAYAMPDVYIAQPNAVSRISIIPDRTTSTNVDVSITGSTTLKATSISMTATLYEYTSGQLIKVNTPSVTQTARNCSSFNFSASFNLSSDKTYKVQVVLKDVTNGVTTSTSKLSNSF
jgi:hypothetical protein